MNSSQAHQILLLEPNPTYNDIRNAYRKLVLELHPDKNKKESDGKKFKQATEAYYYLKKQYKTPSKKTTKTNQNKEKKKGFYKRTNWGNGKTSPEEDWSKFTKEFEEDKDWWKNYEKNFWNKYESANKDDLHEQESSNVKQQDQIDLGVKVDPTLCIACCSCETIAPEVFTIDKTSNMNPKSRVYNSKGAKNLKIMNAAETCPTKAIIVDDLENKKRIFPY